MIDFTHLHVHTQFSILDGAASIKGLLSKAKETGMTALAITDHGNMYGVLEFSNQAAKYGIKPIIGCEVYVAEHSHFDKSSKEDRSGYHLILLARNMTGYRNLSKLVSLGFTEGFYYTPRIDMDILSKYHEGIIACSACLGGQLPKAITRHNPLPQEGNDFKAYPFDLAKSEEVLKRYLDIFGEDFYLELQRHGYREQELVNHAMLKLADKYQLKVIATNDVHYVNKEDFEAHNILICLNTGKDLDDAEGMHYTGNEYLKTPEEMQELFHDIPQAISNTRDLVDKIEPFKLTRDVILPKFPIPEGFESEFQYLEHLTWEGAARRWPEIIESTRERLEFELATIKRMGFPGYFLIVWDFIDAARKMGVRVGPGRGSAAGSAVAYCLGITNIDPIKYQLLFERFLNPERISMPDVDIDFDDEGRGRVIQYVIEKYGKEKVAQIITFGSMAARSSIRDVARVLKLELSEADRLAKLVPEGPKISLESAFAEVPELNDARNQGPELVKKTLNFAKTLEGSIRNTGVHACGVIIGPEDLKEHVPLGIAKDSDMPVTQFEGKLVESIGLLKMDFLGLKTLSIINDALLNIKKRHGIDIDIDSIPLEDEETFALFCRGDTTAVFQFESDGMKKHLQDLQPNRFEDIIAMNALYRPGPMKYIPNYISRKQGREKIEYDFPVMEEYLSETYGITVYQEQVMLLSQAMAGFTKGEADGLRKAMGKKLRDVMDKLKSKFLEGCIKNNLDKSKAEKIWGDWEAFAEYAFNKSHSTCYSYVAYQTAYLKAHYTAEFMAANLTHNLNNIEEISSLVAECKRLKINVLGPDINESELKFTVNKEGDIRFGMGAIKNVGEGPVEAIIEEREATGPFNSIFDFVKRINLRACNKKSIESLAKAGAFDGFPNCHRAQFFFVDKDNITFIEKLIRFATAHQNNQNSSQFSLFGEAAGGGNIPDPELPTCEPWSNLEQLRFENEVTGYYISGHPLDDYKIEIKNFCNINISRLSDLASLSGRDVSFAGIITSVNHRTTKTGKPFGQFVVEDYTDSIQITLFSEDYMKQRHMLLTGTFVYIKAKIQPQFRDSDRLDIKVGSINLLSEIAEKLTHSVTLEIPLSQLSEPLIEAISEQAHHFPGSCRLKVVVYDEMEECRVEMQAKKIKVEASAFLKLLNTYHFLNYSLN